VPVALSLAVLAALAGALALVRGPLRHGGAAPVSLLRQAAVRIRTPGGSGSGTLVSPDGLILTNAHVVAPDAVGQGVLQGDLHRSPPRPVGGIEVYVSRRPTESTGFDAVVVAVDGYLDLALVRVVATIDGAPLPDPKSLALPHVDIAAAGDVQQGTRLRVLGFPTITGPSTVTLTEGTVSGFAADARLGGAVGFVVTDALVGHGNSGGLAADERNRLVGVPTARRESNGDQVAVLRPAALALPMIEALRKGKPYVSPYTKDRRDEAFGALRLVAPSDRPGIEMACVAPTTAVAPAATSLAVAFTYEGFPVDRQDVTATVRQVGQPALLGRVAVGEPYPDAWHEKGCATVTITLDAPLTAGDHVVELWVGGNLVLTASAPFTVATPNPAATAGATAGTTP
jgi:S1-C subfamily serine protease